MKLVLMICASAKEEWAREARTLYQKKISAVMPLEIKELKLKKSSREEREKKKTSDSEGILAELKSDDFVLLFDERGQALTSKEFSKQIQNVLNSGKKRLIFIIGGAYGVNEQVMARANLKVSLSKMVFNHLVAELVVLEQIYRGFAILKNLPYHNE